MATLEVRLLGTFSLIADGGAITTLDAPRLQSLLAHLVLHRDARQPRERIAFLFWPDSEESQARTNLRQAMHLLRRALPDPERFMESDGRALRWRPDAPCRLDVAEFEKLVADAEQARDAGQTRIEKEALESAAAMYAGDLLPGCYDDWIVSERERLREAFVGAAERLADLLEAERDYRGAIPWARRLLDDDPLNEGFCRRLMRVYSMSGDRAGALRVYHGCATALAREVGVAPGAATQEAYENLLESGPPVSPKEIGTAAVGAWPLLGRDDELDALRAAWRRAVEGESLLALIAGEAGIGKSRLGEDLRDWVGRQGAATATSHCYSAAGALAYAPIAELLRSQGVGRALRRLGDAWLSELARLLPELLDERPELSPPPPLTDDWQRTRLLDAVSHAVRAEQRPLLLTIDDLQWCDRETLGWLHYLLRSRPRASLLVVATARSEELTAAHPAHSLLLAARASGQAVELELGPLDRTETATLAGSVSGRELDDEREERIYRETEGNPLFVVEWARAGLAEGAAAAARADAGGDPGMPPRAHSVIEARLAQLSSAGQELASLAATVGREFRFDVLARASPRSEEQVVEALDELWERRIVRERGVDAYDFSHDKLRDVAYFRGGAARRRMRHLRVAQALERLHAADLDGFSSQLAAHYEYAGWVERAIGFYARSGEVAQRVYANEGAIELFSKALELLDGEPPTLSRDERELSLRRALGASLVAIEGYGAAEVHDTYLRARELSERLETRPNPPVLRALALVHVAQGDLGSAHELGRQLLELGEHDDEPMVRVEGSYVLGVTSFWLGEFAAARQNLERAVSEYLPERASAHLALYSQDPRIICTSRLAHTLRYLGHPDEAEEKAREALRLAEELEHPFSLGYALTFAAWLAIDLDDRPRARERAERMAALADEHRLGFLQPMGAILRGWALAGEGRAEEAIARIHEGLDAYSRSGWTLYRPYGFALLARVCLDSGFVEPGRAAVARALELSEQTAQRYLDAELHLLEGELIMTAGGDSAAVESHFSAALEVARRQGSKPLVQSAEKSLERVRALGAENAPRTV